MIYADKTILNTKLLYFSIVLYSLICSALSPGLIRLWRRRRAGLRHYAENATLLFSSQSQKERSRGRLDPDLMLGGFRFNEK